jgi:hypothetical protein
MAPPTRRMIRPSQSKPAPPKKAKAKTANVKTTKTIQTKKAAKKAVHIPDDDMFLIVLEICAITRVFMAQQ